MVLHCGFSYVPAHYAKEKNLSWFYIAKNKFLFRRLAFIYSIEHFNEKKKASDETYI